MENVLKQEQTFANSEYEELENMVLTLIEMNDEEEVLESIYVGSSWARVKSLGKVYVVGIMPNNKIGFGMPVFSKRDIREELGTGATFVPASKNYPDNFGYYLVIKNRASFN